MKWLMLHMCQSVLQIWFWFWLYSYLEITWKDWYNCPFTLTAVISFLLGLCISIEIGEGKK